MVNVTEAGFNDGYIRRIATALGRTVIVKRDDENEEVLYFVLPGRCTLTSKIKIIDNGSAVFWGGCADVTETLIIARVNDFVKEEELFRYMLPIEFEGDYTSTEAQIVLAALELASNATLNGFIKFTDQSTERYPNVHEALAYISSL